MLKCSECPVRQKKTASNVKQDMFVVKSVIDENGYVDKEIKQIIAERLGVSIRQVEKYIKLLESQGGDPEEVANYIEEKGSLNKALKTIKPPSEEKTLLKDFKRLRKTYQKLQYKEFLAFLESNK